MLYPIRHVNAGDGVVPYQFAEPFANARVLASFVRFLLCGARSLGLSLPDNRRVISYLASVVGFAVVFASGSAAQQFQDVSMQAGMIALKAESWGNPIWGDMDRDGFLDLIVPTHSDEPFVYLNNGNGSFADIRATSGIERSDLDSTGWRGFSFGDYDGDGNLDLYIAEIAKGSRLKRDLLFKGHGDGTCENVTVAAGIETSTALGQSAFWLDYDNDGKLDLFVKNYGSPNRLYRNNGDGTFTQVSDGAGLADATLGTYHGTVCSFADYDNDGFMDVAFSGEINVLYRNKGGTFADVTAAAGMMRIRNTTGLAWGDYNNDGLLDLYLARGKTGSGPLRNTLYHNDGDGTFTDVTAEAGLTTTANTWAAVWGDYDNDGFLDLFVACAGAGPLRVGNANFLYHNNGNGTFTNVAAQEGVELQDDFSLHKGAAWGDYDNDGYADLYVSNYGEENFLYHNRGDGTFEEVGKRLGVEKPVMSFPTWFFDYDNDGWLDLFVASFAPSVAEVARGFLGLPPRAEAMKLYRNDTKGGFQDVTTEVGLNRFVPTMGANFGDLDNDGFLDIYLGTGAPSYAALLPNFAFRNRAGKKFADVTAATGAGHLQKGHGVAFGDFDDDGDEDFYVNVGGFVPGDYYNKALFANPGGAHNWISVKLIGAKSNRAAIGAKIKLILTGVNGQKSLRYREVTSGGSFGASSLRQEIGLGRARQIDVMEIWWPAGGVRQVFRDVKVNQFIEIDESNSEYRPRPIPVHRIKATEK
jgi:FG-GAP-like repeat/ASPIC and UnbV